MTNPESFRLSPLKYFGDGTPMSSSNSDLTSRSSGSVTVYALFASIADVYFAMELFIVSSTSVKDERRVFVYRKINSQDLHKNYNVNSVHT